MRPARPSAGVHPALRLVRFGNTIVSFAGTIVGGLVAFGAGIAISSLDGILVVLAAFSTAFVTAGGNVLNDLLDQESDRINHPNRPLVSGEITPRAARSLAVGLFVAAVAVIVPVVFYAPLIALILGVALAALFTYEFRFKAEGFVGNWTIAFLTGLVFLYGGTAAGNPVLLLPFAVMAILATLSREVIKDMEDVAGDVDRRTLPKTRGLPTSTLVARLAVAGAIGLSFVPLAWFVAPASAVGIIYLALVLAADALFVVSIAPLPNRLHWAQTISKGAMAVALVAFLAVAFR